MRGEQQIGKTKDIHRQKDKETDGKESSQRKRFRQKRGGTEVWDGASNRKQASSKGSSENEVLPWDCLDPTLEQVNLYLICILVTSVLMQILPPPHSFKIPPLALLSLLAQAFSHFILV